MVNSCCLTLINKKSPANAKGNVQQRCMFESPVKQNISSPILATMFLLQSQEGTRWPATNYLQYLRPETHRSETLRILSETRPRHDISMSQDRLKTKTSRLRPHPSPLSFSTLVRGDPFRIYGKALRFLKLEFSRHPTRKIWWS